MLSTELARTAIPGVRDKCRTYPVHVRAVLPFDPQDPQDVETWLRRRPEETGDSSRYAGTRSFVIRNLERDVVETIRSAGGRPARGKRKKPLRFGLDAVIVEEQARQRRRVESDGPISPVEVGEIIASALVYLAGGSKPELRQRRRSLTCLGKVYARLYEQLDEGSAQQVMACVIASAPFKLLGVTTKELQEFEERSRWFRTGPDCRAALNAAGLSSPHSDDWEAFREAFMVIYTGEPAPRRGLRRGAKKRGVN
ncbi:MAG TPA: hypothetical protein VEB22_02525 [Phycisphaerales bacterium]|nr:hypothetical protein [Phycisphaerales bacterium]